MRLNPLRAVLAGAVTLGIAVAGAQPAAFSVGGSADSARTTHTDYGFYARGFATRVRGGDVPAGAGTTAFQVVACTSLAGIDRGNNVAKVQLPGAGTAKGLATHLSTHRHPGKVSSVARTHVDRVNLADTPLGSLSLGNITSVARASHDGTGYHSTGHTTLGSITLTPPTGPDQTFPAPAPGQTLEIPGVAKITVGSVIAHQYQAMSKVRVRGVIVEFEPTSTKVVVAASKASVAGNVVSGIFKGQSYGSRINALTGIAKSGRNPLSIMPCQGTNGHTRMKHVARVTPGGGLVVRGIYSRQRGNQTATKAHGIEKGGVAKLNLGDGQLVVSGVIGRVHVVRTQHGIHRDTKGSTFGTITANGEAQSFPPTGVLEIPGVAKLHRHIVTRYKHGIGIVALRIKLLDGSGAVIDLGAAKLKIQKP